MNICGLRADGPFVQAPLAGVTDSAFRTIARRFHGGLLFTEMVSAEALCRGHRRTLRYTEIREGHRPTILQLVGGGPDRMALAASLAEGMGADGIDINAGCPRSKVTGPGAGGALLRDPERLAAIVRAVRKAVSVPVSVKMRLGYSRDESLFLAPALQEAGADFLTVHGRTVSMGFSGESDWQAIRQLVEALDIPVLANGDARNEALAVGLLKRTGAAGVMLGRGTRGRPDLPGTALSLLETGSFRRMGHGTLMPTIMEHARLEQELFGDLAGMKRMRKHVTWYLRAAGLGFDTREVYALEDTDALGNLLERAVSAKD